VVGWSCVGWSVSVVGPLGEVMRDLVEMLLIVVPMDVYWFIRRFRLDMGPLWVRASPHIVSNRSNASVPCTASSGSQVGSSHPVHFTKAILGPPRPRPFFIRITSSTRYSSTKGPSSVTGTITGGGRLSIRIYDRSGSVAALSIKSTWKVRWMPVGTSRRTMSGVGTAVTLYFA
jgi:hypothetical protein